MRNCYSNYKHRPIVGEKVDWAGYWLTSYRFYHTENCHRYFWNRSESFDSEIQNIHTFFRKKFVVGDKKISDAKLFITGDDLYKLFFNAQFVGEGPAQSFPFAYNYNCYDVTDLIKNGENTIAVQLYYQGLFNIYAVSADNLCGMIAQLEITFEDGTTQTVLSDKTWKYSEIDAYSGIMQVFGHTQFAEDIDLQKYPKNWRENDFDDSRWSKPLRQGKPLPMEYTLVPQITPTVKHEYVYPVEIKKIENGYWFDFGTEMTGSVFTWLKGNKGDRVEFRYGEELLDDGRVRFDIRANCHYVEIVTLTGEEDFTEFFEYKGFRYAEILNPPENFEPEKVYVFNRNYPYPDKIANFKCSNELMNKVWEISVNTLKAGVQDTYYDCPTRERGGFVGDALLSSMPHLIITGDLRIYVKYLVDLLNSSRYSPTISAHVPSYNLNFCAEYSSLVPLFLENYYVYTGDKLFLKELLPVAEGVWDYFSDFLNDDGLLEAIQHIEKVPKTMAPILLDWPKNHRDDYDFDEFGHKGICTSVNMFFYGFLKTLAKLYRIVENNDRAQELEAIYTKMGNSIIEKTYDYEKGLFKDTPVSNHCSLHANTLQLCFELLPPRGYEPIINFIKEKRFSCSLGFGYWVILGLYTMGEDAFAYDLLTCKDERSWHTMISEGATTLFEAWGKEQKWNTSLCQPWGAYPVTFYTHNIMGIKPHPGMKSFTISPSVDDSLDFAEIELPIPDGWIKAAFKREEKGIVYTISAPKNIELIFDDKPNVTFINNSQKG